MPQIINTNIASLTAQRNLNNSQKLSDTALQRLSSGLRINSAKDDAAGLAISTRFDAQVRGANQAIRNSGDAISLAQTTEGALSSITTSLQRMRELALQSANDTNTAVDRQALQEEVAQLVAEIKNVAETSNFNGKRLLDGSLTNATFQTGTEVGDTISFGIGKVSTDSLGSNKSAGISSAVQSAAIVNGSDGNALVAGDLVINGFSVQASIGSDDTASTVEKRSSAIAKAAAINKISDSSGITATVNANYVAGSTGATNDSTSVDLAINGVTIALQSNSALTVEQNLQQTADAINAESGVTGVRAVAGTYASQGVSLIADDGRNIAIGSTVATATATAAANELGILSAGSTGLESIYLGTYTLVSENGSDIAITSDTGEIDSAGFEEGTFSGVNSGVISEGGTASTAANALATGDLVINGVSVGATANSQDTFSSTLKSASAIAKADAINQVSDESGVTAEVLANRVYSGTIVAATIASDLVINGVTAAVSFGTGDDVDVKLNAIIEAVNNVSGTSGVRAEALDGDSFTLIADDGRNIDVDSALNMTGIEETTFVSALALKSGGDINLSSLTTDIGNSGFRIGEFGGGTSGTLLESVDISTVKGANNAITAIDNALETVATISAQLGAVQNRFDSVISNLQLRSENLAAANSRIKDADFAAETARLTKSQVLQQAGISILAQANARPQQVLSLLG
jgi:flagellin